MKNSLCVDSGCLLQNPGAVLGVDVPSANQSCQEMQSLEPGDLLGAVSHIFESLNRALVCLNASYEVVHVSQAIDQLLGKGTAETMVGKSAENVFGAALFGPDAPLRRALDAGERREGWGARVQNADGHWRMLSVTVSPVLHNPNGPCDPRVSFVLVARAAEDSEVARSSAPTLFSGMVARSQAMLQIFQLIERLEESDATVLITGPSGTGKELIARAVHANSNRRKGPFVAVNCGALPGDLLESELFGHVKGAFTGAIRDRDGRFEVARGGTIFLDEVGDLPLHLQVKLLRVLQERTFERVGESTPRTADVRVIAATNKDMKRAVLEGEFRDDLYYRLRVVPIAVPPLSRRREDIEPIARYVLARVNRRHDRSVRLAPDAMGLLLRYDWPGNVRELENALEFALAVTTGQTIHAADLPAEITDPEHRLVLSPAEEPVVHLDAGRLAGRSSAPQAGPSPGEMQQIRSVLERHRWNRSEAARALGVSRSTLWRKMREYGLME